MVPCYLYSLRIKIVEGQVMGTGTLGSPYLSRDLGAEENDVWGMLPDDALCWVTFCELK